MFHRIVAIKVALLQKSAAGDTASQNTSSPSNASTNSQSLVTSDIVPPNKKNTIHYRSVSADSETERTTANATRKQNGGIKSGGGELNVVVRQTADCVVIDLPHERSQQQQQRLLKQKRRAHTRRRRQDANTAADSDSSDTDDVTDSAAALDYSQALGSLPIKSKTATSLKSVKSNGTKAPRADTMNGDVPQLLSMRRIGSGADVKTAAAHQAPSAQPIKDDKQHKPHSNGVRNQGSSLIAGSASGRSRRSVDKNANSIHTELSSK